MSSRINVGFGGIELVERKRNELLDAIGETFDFDARNALILHPTRIEPGQRRHVDTVIKESEDEATIITFGCSAIKIVGRPYSEAFGKCKGTTEDDIKYADKLIRIACGVTSEDPEGLECQLLNGYEYAFLDYDDWFHEKDGYWGLFIVPKLSCRPKGWRKNVDYYQIIPAFKEELQFIEDHPEADYHRLCEEIVKAIPERQYLNEKSKKLSKKALEKVLQAALS